MAKRIKSPEQNPLPPLSKKTKLASLAKCSYKPCPEKALKSQMQKEKNDNLLEAAKSNEWSWAERLLERGAEPNSRDGSKLTALTYAAACGKLDLVKQMVGNTTVSIRDPAINAAYVRALGNGHSEVASFLLENGDFLEPVEAPASKTAGITIKEEKWGAAKGYVGVDGFELPTPKIKL